jgi:hypothetical protein
MQGGPPGSKRAWVYSALACSCAVQVQVDAESSYEARGAAVEPTPRREPVVASPLSQALLR